MENPFFQRCFLFLCHGHNLKFQPIDVVVSSYTGFYEKDKATSVDPRKVPQFDDEKLASFPDGYKFLAYGQSAAYKVGSWVSAAVFNCLYYYVRRPDQDRPASKSWTSTR